MQYVCWAGVRDRQVMLSWFEQVECNETAFYQIVSEILDLFRVPILNNLEYSTRHTWRVRIPCDLQHKAERLKGSSVPE
jgi:hypothetical protein